jgi:hypothetical protein
MVLLVLLALVLNLDPLVLLVLLEQLAQPELEQDQLVQELPSDQVLGHHFDRQLAAYLAFVDRP